MKRPRRPQRAAVLIRPIDQEVELDGTVEPFTRTVEPFTRRGRRGPRCSHPSLDLRD